MKTIAEKRLFWYLKDAAEFDLSDKIQLDMYVQQCLSRGNISDVKTLLSKVKSTDFIDSLERIKNFLTKEVKRFWEEWLADINRPSKTDT